MRIENITGNGSWNPVSVPVDSGTYDVRIQNNASVATDIRLTNNPTETWTIKSGTVGDFLFVPRANQQLEVNAASGTIQVIYTPIRY